MYKELLLTPAQLLGGGSEAEGVASPPPRPPAHAQVRDLEVVADGLDVGGGPLGLGADQGGHPALQQQANCRQLFCLAGLLLSPRCEALKESLGGTDSSWADRRLPPSTTASWLILSTA